jgi:LEA14-like dessication related protein
MRLAITGVLERCAGMHRHGPIRSSATAAWRGYLTLFVAALLAGCATVGTLDEPPTVSLVHIEPEEFQLLEQRYRITLRVLNPNDAPLTVRGLSYEIHLNDRLFGNGVSGERVTIPAYGDETISVTLVSNLARVYEQFRQLTESEEVIISYAIMGRLSVEGALGKVPFDYEGELDLAAPGGSAMGRRI